MTDRGPDEELAYIRYSAKEILFHLTGKVEALQADVNKIKLDLQTELGTINRNMVTRTELTTARRWAVGATITAVATAIAVIGLFV